MRMYASHYTRRWFAKYIPEWLRHRIGYRVVETVPAQCKKGQGCLLAVIEFSQDICCTGDDYITVKGGA